MPWNTTGLPYKRTVIWGWTYQTLVSEGIVNAPDEEPERPQILKSELQDKICQQHQSPHHQELQIQKRTGKKENKF